MAGASSMPCWSWGGRQGRISNTGCCVIHSRTAICKQWQQLMSNSEIISGSPSKGWKTTYPAGTDPGILKGGVQPLIRSNLY